MRHNLMRLAVARRGKLLTLATPFIASSYIWQTELWMGVKRCAGEAVREWSG